MYLKIPEYLPARKSHRIDEDGIITFTNNSSTDKIWADPNLQIIPQVETSLYFQQHNDIKCIRLGHWMERVKEGVYLLMQYIQVKLNKTF